MLSLTPKNIYNLIGWEKYNTGRISTLFQYLYSLTKSEKKHNIRIP